MLLDGSRDGWRRDTQMISYHVFSGQMCQIFAMEVRDPLEGESEIGCKSKSKFGTASGTEKAVSPISVV